MWGVITTWPFSLQATRRAAEILERGGGAIDAAEQGIWTVESDPEVDSVGLGGFLNRDGGLELDAAMMDGDTLRGGSIDMNFGDYKVDFRKVRTFQNDCLLKIDQNFGSLTIFLPSNVRLVKSSDTSFGSFATYGEPSPDATQSIIIRADVNFGTLQVKYE